MVPVSAFGDQLLTISLWAAQFRSGGAILFSSQPLTLGTFLTAFMLLRPKLQCRRTNAKRVAVGLAFLVSLLGAADATARPANPGSRCPAISTNALVPNAPLSSSHFAIADLDGDRKPDLATVELQSVGSSRSSQYFIRLELSERGVQNFGLTAPAGGLQIVARDVNGDSFLDLLVRTEWQDDEVAVLLNDGHGNFTLADPRGFAASLQEYAPRWETAAAAFCETALLVRRESSSRGILSVNGFDRPAAPIARTIQARASASSRPKQSCCPVRAPPALVPTADISR